MIAETENLSRLTLIELFNLPREQSRDEADPDQIQRTLVHALDVHVTKLARVQALLLTAPEPWTSGLQKRLFDVLWAEDAALAIDIILDAYSAGAVVHEYLLDRLPDMQQPEQLRQAIGILAADIKDDFASELFLEGRFAAIHRFNSLATQMHRLIDLRHREFEIGDFARGIVDLIATTRGTDLAPRGKIECLRQTLHSVIEQADAPLTQRTARQRKHSAPPPGAVT